MLNARAARDLFGEPAAAVGRHVRIDKEPPREIIGVVADVRSTFFNTLEWRTDPIVYRPAEQGLTAFARWGGDGKARGVRILGISERRATPPAGMRRPRIMSR